MKTLFAAFILFLLTTSRIFSQNYNSGNPTSTVTVQLPEYLTAIVYIDNEKVGYAEPVLKLNASTGNHKLKVARTNTYDKNLVANTLLDEQITVKSGINLSVTLDAQGKAAWKEDQANTSNQSGNYQNNTNPNQNNGYSNNNSNNGYQNNNNQDNGNLNNNGAGQNNNYPNSNNTGTNNGYQNNNYPNNNNNTTSNNGYSNGNSYPNNNNSTQNYPYNNTNPNYGYQNQPRNTYGNQNYIPNQRNHSYSNPQNNNQNYYNRNNSTNTNTNQPLPVSNLEFNQFMNALRGTTGDRNKSQLAFYFLQQQNILSAQAYAILHEFSFDNNRLRVAKMAYDRTLDKQKFYIVFETFYSNINKRELERYINFY